MNRPADAFVSLLEARSPEEMYDALHAGRYLSDIALRSPGEVIALIKATMISYRPRPLFRDRKLELIAQALANSNYLNESGTQLYRGETDWQS